jgi:NADH-quinone oxidoreductase subunit E
VTSAGWDESVDLEQAPAVVPELAETEVPDGLRREIEEIVARYSDRHSAALPALHAAQRVHGWCSPEAIEQVAAVMRVTPAYLSSITTFYDMLNTEPVGRRYVYVCTSVACNLVGAQQVFEALREAGAELEDVHIRQFECMGACDMAPMASVDGRYIGPLHPSDAEEVVAAIREGRTPLPGRGLERLDERAPEPGDG